MSLLISKRSSSDLTNSQKSIRLFVNQAQHSHENHEGHKLKHHSREVIRDILDSYTSILWWQDLKKSDIVPLCMFPVSKNHLKDLNVAKKHLENAALLDNGACSTNIVSPGSYLEVPEAGFILTVSHGFKRCIKNPTIPYNCLCSLSNIPR